MDEPPAPLPKRRMGCGGWIFGTIVVLCAISYLIPTFGVYSQTGDQTTACNNSRQIIKALKVYAADHNGEYPTGSTANEAFRRLIREGIISDELIFGCPSSRSIPDGNPGEAPNFLQALEPAENHWMLVDGMNEKSTDTQALILENSLDTTWPPKWRVDSAGTLAPGRVWKRNKIIIGHNDNSVTVEPVAPKTGLLESQFQPDSPFPIPQGNLKLLDIEE